MALLNKTQLSIMKILEIMKYFAKNICVLTLVGLMTMGAMTGCKDDLKPEAQQKDRIAVNLRLVAERSSNLKLSNDRWEATDRIGLYMKKAGQAITAAGAIYVDGNNLKMTYSDASRMLDSEEPLYYPKGEFVDFVAYYPWQETIGAGCTIAIDLEDQSASLPSELLYSNNVAEQAPSEEVVDLVFNYAYAKIMLTVYLPDRQPADVANMSVSLTGMNSKATFQLTDGTFTGLQSGNPIKFFRTGTQNSVAFFEAFIMPANVGEESKFVFQAAGRTYEVSAAGNYVAGGLYVFDYSIGKPDFNILEVNDIIIIGPSASVTINNLVYLTAIINPSTAHYNNCYWTSSNPEVAEITNSSTEVRTGELKAISEGTTLITATSYDNIHKAEFSVTVTKYGNRLINYSFEDPVDNITNTFYLNVSNIPGWETVLRTWFDDFYKYGEELEGPKFSPQWLSFQNTGRVSQLSHTSWWNGNGQFFCAPNLPWLEGRWALRVGTGAASTSGFYQIVPVTPGETYKFGGTTGARVDTNNQSARTETLKILSSDGMTIYYSEDIDYLYGKRDEHAWQLISGNTYSTCLKVEGRFTVPDDVTQVRLQYNHRSWDSPNNAPIILWDQMFFEFVDE